MQRGYEAIQAEGAEIIAISADPPPLVVTTRQRLNLTYLILSDAEKEAISAYNVVDPSNPRIARPATYIIDETGIIRWKFLDEKFDIRLTSEQIIAELKKL